MNRLKKIFVLILLSAISIPTSAFAFCGFYVGGAGAEMFADATQVVLLREGTRTVLSMQNRYQGPLENFAMVIPVSEVIMQDQVKTLSPDLFQKIDTLSSPRLVEYWAEDPCYPQNNATTLPNNGTTQNNASTNNGVVVEAQFEVGEYEITVLSTTESSALETWLTGNGFALPAGAAAYLEPYVQSGDYFFAAKVNVDKVTFDSEGKAVLSPLRFYMDSEDFELPIRLGMVNSNGKQDLIVYILGEDRYELKNYPNVTIPTNIRVVDEVRNDFPAFYRALFSRTIKENPGAAITEYAWAPSNCDPCPGPVIDVSDLLTFGGDVVADPEQIQWVLTRLHLQYEKDQIGEDLIFKKADPIVGGREIYLERDKLENGATSSDFNNFQARYIIRHPWMGAVECEDPYSIWGGAQTSSTALSPNSTGEDAFSAGTENIDTLIIGNIPELEITGTGKAPVGTVKTGSNNEQIDDTNNGVKGSGGKATAGCSAVDSGKSFSFGFFLLLGFFLIRRASKKD